jgi:glutaconate CoA-transferase subunit A
VIHAQQVDHDGNVHLWGITGVQKEAVLAARRRIVTVEECVSAFEPRKNSVVLPAWVVDAVCVVPDGAYPSYALGYSRRANDFYTAWDAVARDRRTFAQWIDTHVRDVEDHAQHLELLARNGHLV